ncbi:MAG: amidohydrolase family protein [Spirochaetota bacterium]
MATWSIQGVTVLTPEKAIDNGNVLISGDTISEVSPRAVKAPLELHISDGVLCPGFINAHDHLLGNYYPKVGDGRPYLNWLPWDCDLKNADVYRERQQIENRDLYLLGAYRNLLSGVTMVADLIPHFVNDPYVDILPTKMLTKYAMAHSVASFALNWGDGIVPEYQKAEKNDIPFITHCSEGFDEETIKDVKTLERLGALGEYSVLVHGVAFSKADIDLISQRHANVVWCADSNLYMYDKTMDIKYLIEKGVNVSIGTDSPMSGGLNTLHEIKVGKKHYKDTYGEELPDKQIVKMMTSNPAKALRLKSNGKIESGKLADIVVFNHKGGDPYASIVSARLADVKLVVIEGIPVYGNAEYADLFDSLDVEYQNVNVDGVDKLIVGDLIGLLKRISRAVGFKKEFPFMPVRFDV